MQEFSGIALWLASGGTAFLAAFVAVSIAGHLERKNVNLLSGYDPADEGTVFLFHGDSILDCTPRAERFLAASTATGSDWSRMMGLLSLRFPDFKEHIAALDDVERLKIESVDGNSQIVAETAADIVRIKIEDIDTETTKVELDQASYFAMEAELETLRVAAEESAFLVWRQTREGTVTWANRAYLDAVQHASIGKSSSTWPPATLFNQKILEQVYSSNSAKRISLGDDKVSAPQWFEVHCAPVAGEYLFSAVDVNATVRAENQLREFMQTLTKTFAHLTIGLAVFDRARRLALFNPALGELTELPIDFLTGRPSLVGFLDRLRDIQMIPEPKDYKAWRQKMAELEAAAANGEYSETWTLPSGQTYRVTGRPHPGGAVAFLFEDISAEMSLTRRFRSELEMNQSIIDSLQEAIAVFSQDGTLAVTNQPYSEMWNEDAADPVADLNILEATRTWMAGCAPTPMWGELRDFVSQGRDRETWVSEIRRADGTGMQCRIAPLLGGYTLVGFTEMAPSLSASEPSREIA